MNDAFKETAVTITTKAQKVTAVIVTFNRKALLMRTLKAIYEQTCPVDVVIIIDNASKDGTKELLNQQGYFDKPNLIYYCLDTNTGGAGGFYEGVKQAHESGADWLWLMDDDGYPTPQCLEQLLAYKNDLDFFGPLVLSDQDKFNLSFPMTLPVSKKVIRNKDELSEQNTDKVLREVLIPFNGVLLKSSLVSTIGYPLAKFFIWGDDIEYTKRAQRVGARIATISDIEFYHPTAPSLGTPMLFGRMQFNDTDSMIKLYCLCRNNTANLKTYHGTIPSLLFVGKTIWFYSVTKPSFNKLKFCLRGLYDGLIGDFNRHRQYIGRNFN